MAFDEKLKELVNPKNKKSFFLFAGAGTGKTYTLVELLKEIDRVYAKDFKVRGKHCAVITYTNAATDEIKRRISYSSLFSVSTIHSFVWILIKPFQKDIKRCLISSKQLKYDELKEKVDSAKNKTTKTYNNNVEKLKELADEVEELKQIESFSYDPNGGNQGKGALNHADILNIGAELISTRALMQDVLVGAFPIVIIDEGQDTSKKIMDALLEVYKNHPDDFKLGVLGDVKQRIYLDGEPEMESLLDDAWTKEKLGKNWRSDKRIVRLANKIAANLQENSEIEPQEDAEEGFVHLYIKGYGENLDRVAVEKSVKEDMSKVTGDNKWTEDKEVEELLLEHRMAASRLGFVEFYDTLQKVKKYKQGFLDGTVSDMGIFRNVLIPLKQALKRGDKSEVYRIVNSYSILLQDNNYIKSLGNKSLEILHNISAIIDKFSGLLLDDNTVIGKIVDFIIGNDLFEVPKTLRASLQEAIDDEPEEVTAWRNACLLPFKQVERYFQYANDETEFATHQGVKGLEYPRVMVIIDEETSKGTLFSYEKLFGVKQLSDRDKENEQQGKENVMDRTMRLFYVICTRAKHSLAILAYTQSPETVKQTCLEKGWLEDNEISTL